MCFVWTACINAWFFFFTIFFKDRLHARTFFDIKIYWIVLLPWMNHWNEMNNNKLPYLKRIMTNFDDIQSIMFSYGHLLDDCWYLFAFIGMNIIEQLNCMLYLSVNFFVLVQKAINRWPVHSYVLAGYFR